MLGWVVFSSCSHLSNDVSFTHERPFWSAIVFNSIRNNVCMCALLCGGHSTSGRVFIWNVTVDSSHSLFDYYIFVFIVFFFCLRTNHYSRNLLNLLIYWQQNLFIITLVRILWSLRESQCIKYSVVGQPKSLLLFFQTTLYFTHFGPLKLHFFGFSLDATTHHYLVNIHNNILCIQFIEEL